MPTHIQWRWHLDEVYVWINGETHYLWRAVDHVSERWRAPSYAAPWAALSAENIRSIRPGYGMVPKRLPNVLGRAAARDLKRGEPLETI